MISKATFPTKKRMFTDLCLLVWINPQMSFWLCEYKNRLFHIVRKSCKSKWLTAEVLVTYHQTFFFIYMVAVHSWWHLRSFQQYTHLWKLKNLMQQNIWSNNFKKFAQTVQRWFGERFHFDTKVLFWICSFWSSDLPTRESYGAKLSKQ